MNLLVTGGAGFIGSHVVRHALRQPEVACLVNLDCLTYAGHLENLADVSGHPKYRFEQVDLRDAPAVHRVIQDHAITHVMHLAAESHVDRSILAPAHFIHTNILGTFHLLEACRARAAASPVRLLHVSTDEVYGSLGPEGHFTENSPYAPRSPYSASKASSDLLVRAAHNTYGLDAVITNCSNNYGPNQFPDKLIPVVIQAALEGQPIPVYGDGLHVRDWLFVEDHAAALWLALTRGRPGQTYNLGGDNEWPNLRLVEQLCDLVDELAPAPRGPSRGRIRHVQDRPGHDRRYAVDSAKARRELGWQPAVEFTAGLRRTVQWYLDHQAWITAVRQSARQR
jgi:dTDP-glucose 4,6-dehydratase